jgi:hypothetical protein
LHKNTRHKYNHIGALHKNTKHKLGLLGALHKNTKRKLGLVGGLQKNTKQQHPFFPTITEAVAESAKTGVCLQKRTQRGFKKFDEKWEKEIDGILQ